MSHVPPCILSQERYRWHGPTADLSSYGNTTQPESFASDNDGLWTGMLLMAQTYRFAATKDKAARADAWRSVAAMEVRLNQWPLFRLAAWPANRVFYTEGRVLQFLHNVTGTPGFSARSAVKCADPHGGGDSGPCNKPGADPKTCGWVRSTVCYEGVDEGGDCCCECAAAAFGFIHLSFSQPVLKMAVV